MPYWLLLLSIMIGAGAFSGLTSALWEQRANNGHSAAADASGIENSDSGSFAIVAARHVMLATLAALTVPLFLQTISSDLLKKSETGPDENHLFIFGGLCLLAGFYASAYLQRLSSQVLKQLAETKRIAVHGGQTAEFAKSKVIALEAAQGEEPETSEEQ